MSIQPAPVTTTIAVGAVSSPWWLDALESASDGAALIIPILGAVWLIVQIVRALWSWPKRAP